MEHKNFFLLSLCCFFLIKTYSQNLIPNGDFEINTTNPSSWGQAYLLESWIGVVNGKWSPVTYFYDYEDIGYVPTWKEGGKQSPFSGHGFIGFGIALKKVQETGSQYLETKLFMPLEKDSIYIITAYVSLADRVRYAIDYIPVALSDKSMLPNKKIPIYISNLIKLKSDMQYLDNTTNWMKVSTTYKAKGGEYYFMIGGVEGSKKNDSEFKTKIMPFQPSFQYFLLRKLTYYFIDKVSIQKLTVPTPKLTNLSVLDSIPLQVKKEDQIIINDVAFAFNSYHLKDTLNQQLDTLASILIKHNEYKIQILGYTDDLGTKKFNNELSTMRAKTIYNYLNRKGVSYERMEYKGLGECNPFDKNNSEEGRAKNRRVEILIIK